MRPLWGIVLLFAFLGQHQSYSADRPECDLGKYLALREMQEFEHFEAGEFSPGTTEMADEVLADLRSTGTEITAAEEATLRAQIFAQPLTELGILDRAVALALAEEGTVSRKAIDQALAELAEDSVSPASARRLSRITERLAELLGANLQLGDEAAVEAFLSAHGIRGLSVTQYRALSHAWTPVLQKQGAMIDQALRDWARGASAKAIQSQVPGKRFVLFGPRLRDRVPLTKGDLKAIAKLEKLEEVGPKTFNKAVHGVADLRHPGTNQNLLDRYVGSKSMAKRAIGAVLVKRGLGRRELRRLISFGAEKMSWDDYEELRVLVGRICAHSDPATVLELAREAIASKEIAVQTLGVNAAAALETHESTEVLLDVVRTISNPIHRTPYKVAGFAIAELGRRGAAISADFLPEIEKMLTDGTKNFASADSMLHDLVVALEKRGVAGAREARMHSLPARIWRNGSHNTHVIDEVKEFDTPEITKALQDRAEKTTGEEQKFALEALKERKALPPHSGQ